ncbi:hypothetical protein ACKWTF_002565 [Chironomus riparius]
MCTLFSKSHNNDKSMNMKKNIKRKSKTTLCSRNRSLCLLKKQSQQSRGICATLNQVFNGLLIFVSAISLQGSYSNKKDNLLSVKITIFLLMLFGFIIAQFYSGSIVSSLLDTKHESIKTVQDLINSHLNLAMENVPYDIDLFNKTKDPLLRKMYHKKIIKHDEKSSKTEYNIFNPEYGMVLVKSGTHAFHVTESTAYEIISKTFDERLICKLSEIEVYRPNQLVVNVQKNSTFRELYTYGIRRLKEVGIMDRWGKIFYLKKPKCVRNLKASDFNVNISAVFPLLILLSCGFLISFLVLIAEIYISHRK